MRIFASMVLLMFLSLQMVKGQDAAVVQEAWSNDLMQLQQNGMMVLGSWALGNLAVSGYHMTRTSGVTYSFHQMNVFWNTVNLGIALGGYFGAASLDPSMGSLEVYNEYNNFGKILLFNTGLDVAYVMTGFFLRERSGNVQKHSKRLKGYGNSLILQGGFLFAFDLVLFLLTEQTLGDLTDSGQLQVAVMPAGAGVRLVF